VSLAGEHDPDAAAADAAARQARFADAVPDLVTAATFAFAWLFPLAAPGLVRTLVLVALLEFVLLHAAGAYHSIGMAGGSVRFQRGMGLAMAALYSLFIIGSVIAFEEWWPVPVFAWLVWGKMRPARGADDEGVRSREIVIWGISFVAYMFTMVLSAAVPLPRLALTPDTVARLELPGSGSFVEEPHTVMAFGVLYFGILAFVRTRRLAVRPGWRFR
jgi:hypothetical protein